MGSNISSCKWTRQAERLLRSELGELGGALALDIGRQAKEASEAADTGRRISKTGIIAERLAKLLVCMSNQPRKPMTQTDLCRAVGLGKESLPSIVPYVKGSIGKGHDLFKMTAEKTGGKRVGERFRLADHIADLLEEQQASRVPQPPDLLPNNRVKGHSMRVAGTRSQRRLEEAKSLLRQIWASMARICWKKFSAVLRKLPAVKGLTTGLQARSHASLPSLLLPCPKTPIERCHGRIYVKPSVSAKHR